MTRSRLNSDDAARRARARAQAAAVDPQGRARVLVDRLRAGMISPEHVSVAGWLGDEAARLVVPPWVPPPDQANRDRRWPSVVRHALYAAPIEVTTLASLAADFAEHALPRYEALPTYGRPFPRGLRMLHAEAGEARRLRDAIQAARDWAACPCEKHRAAAALAGNDANQIAWAAERRLPHGASGIQHAAVSAARAAFHAAATAAPSHDTPQNMANWTAAYAATDYAGHEQHALDVEWQRQRMIEVLCGDRPMVRSNAGHGDARMRDLERQLAAGDPSAAGQVAIEQIRATGQLDSRWVSSLLRTPALVAVDAALRQSGQRGTAADRSDMPISLLCQAYGWILYDMISWVGAGGRTTWIPPVVQILVPDRFGRPGGILLRVALREEERERAESAYTFRHMPDDADAEEVDRKLDALSAGQPWVQIEATLTYDPQAHPWYYHLYRSPSDRDASAAGGNVPVRRGEDSILLSELQQDGGSALAECVDEAIKQIDVRLGLVDPLLHRVRDVWGVRTYEDAVRFAANRNDWADVHLALMSVTPPPFPGWVAQPRSATGSGFGEAALSSLGAWLMSQRAEVEYRLPDPFDLRPGLFVYGQLSVLSRRSTRSPRPFTISAAFDTVAGRLERLGDRWRGNRVPPQGEWKLDYSRATATTQVFVQSVRWWLKAHLPGARVLVGSGDDWQQVQ